MPTWAGALCCAATIRGDEYELVRLSILSWSLVSVEDFAQLGVGGGEMRQTSSLQASFEENIAFSEGS